LLKALKVTGITGQKQTVSVRQNVETKHKQLVALKDHADLLQQKYANVAGRVTGGGSNVSMQFDVSPVSGME
jgi:hypothetical protein